MKISLNIIKIFLVSIFLQVFIFSSDEIICNNCNYKNPESTKYCDGCGKNLGKPVICSNCNFENQPDDQYCMNCMLELKNISSVKTTEATAGLIKEISKENIVSESESLDAALDKIYKKAERYVKTRKFEPGLKLLNEVLAKNDKYPNAFRERGVAWFNLHKYENAKNDFLKALEINPNDALAYTDIAVLEMLNSNYDKALELLNKAINVNPDCANAYVVLGNIENEKNKNISKAIEYYNKALSVDPVNSYAYCQRAGISFDRNDIDGAIADWTKATECDPYNATSFFNLGLCYMGRDTEKAMDCYSTAIILNDEYLAAYINRGNIYLKIDDYNSAISDFESALSVAPDFGLAKKNLKKALDRKEQKEQPLKFYSKHYFIYLLLIGGIGIFLYFKYLNADKFE